jgi:hypothetical protein
MPCYATMISSPDLVAAAAPACANFYLSLVPRGSAGGAKVQQFYGEKDSYNAAIGNGPGLIAQGRDAANLLTRMGYDLADPVMVRDTGHSPMVKQVVTFFKSQLGGKRGER